MYRSTAVPTLLVLVLLSPSLSVAQEPDKNVTAPAPFPSQIAAAKKIFVSNATGEEIEPRFFFLPEMRPEDPYNRFYNGLKNSGRYELVSAPSDADLVLELRFGFFLPPFAAHRYVVGSDPFDPHLRLSILDPKTHVLLWALSERVNPASGMHWKEKREANFDRAVAALVGDFAKLATAAAPEGAH